MKAVLFDLDGTLLDRDTSVQKFISKQYERLNLSLKHIPHDMYVSRFVELDCHGYVWKDQVYQQLTTEFEITGVSWNDLLEDYISQFAQACVPFPHLQTTLDLLTERNLLLGCITNGRGQFQMNNIRALGIEKYFSVILVSEWEGIKKPDPLIFQRALNKLGVTEEDCIYIGDHPINDVEAAKKAGWKAIWKRDTHWEEPAYADYVIDDLREIIIYLNL